MIKIRLILDNQNIIIQNANIKIARMLEGATSYLVQGHYFHPAFRMRRWDGREHLMVFKRGQYQAPIGLLGIIRKKLEENNIKYEIKQKKVAKTVHINYEWNENIELRYYQKEAIRAFCSAPEAGRGILKMPIRSGKTKTAAGIIQHIKTRTLFLVPSQMLLYQTAKSLEESLPGTHIGVIGDKNWDEGQITVATIQTLAHMRGGAKRLCPGNVLRDKSGRQIKGKYTEAKALCGKKQCHKTHNFITKSDERYKPLITGYPLVIFDECFVAGTMIGNRRIEDIKIGDLVPSFIPETMKMCYKKVKHIFVNKPSSLIRIKTFYDEIICTSNHPVFTERGFVSAIDLIPSVDIMFCNRSKEFYDAMHCLREKDNRDIELGQKKPFEENRPSVLFNNMRQESNWKNDFKESTPLFQRNERSIKQKDERKQSYEESRNQSKTECNAESNGAYSAMVERWQRQTNICSCENVISCTRGRLESGTYCKNESANEDSQFAKELQDRHRSPGSESSNRSGRVVAPNSGSKKTRHEKGYFLERARVESVEILQPGSDGEYNGLCSKGVVYNLEVEDTHTYLANNLAVHNCHHLTGDVWHKVFMDIPAKYRLGLSATVHFDSKKENERGVIWLRACCGDIKYEVSVSELIDKGYLMRQHVEINAIRKPQCEYEGWSKDLQNRCIYNNPYRNMRIILDAQNELNNGHNVMIVTNRKSQIKDLVEIMDRHGMEYVTVTGSDPQDVRDERVQAFKCGDVSIIVGTVFGEGVDIPEIECVINAEGGQDIKATIQRMRNMTPMEGKTTSKMIDYWDDTNPYFRKHSKKRISTYESEPAFIVNKTWQ